MEYTGIYRISQIYSATVKLNNKDQTLLLDYEGYDDDGIAPGKYTIYIAGCGKTCSEKEHTDIQ